MFTVVCEKQFILIYLLYKYIFLCAFIWKEKNDLLQIGKEWFILVGSVEKTNGTIYGKEHSYMTTLLQTALHWKCINVLNIQINKKV